MAFWHSLELERLVINEINTHSPLLNLFLKVYISLKLELKEFFFWFLVVANNLWGFFDIINL